MNKYITKEHRKEIEKEIKTLESQLRGKVADKLSSSTSKDQAEDSTYAEAIQERDMLRERIAALSRLLEEVEIIDDSVCNTEYVTLGAWITVELNGKRKKLRLVGASESSPTKGKISYESPLGEALVGAKVGEIVYVLGPNGNEQEIKVISIECEE